MIIGLDGELKRIRKDPFRLMALTIKLSLMHSLARINGARDLIRTQGKSVTAVLTCSGLAL
jgi:hypothetical protein